MQRVQRTEEDADEAGTVTTGGNRYTIKVELYNPGDDRIWCQQFTQDTSAPLRHWRHDMQKLWEGTWAEIRNRLTP